MKMNLVFLLQGFEYDVHLESTEETGNKSISNGDGNAHGHGDDTLNECNNTEKNQPTTDEDKKEFSFTFYDLDGHGKITKDVC